eukprot:GHVT01038928.1.p1 GENE.GHVT01038928.1~~GHVT01038928.1.p1  ORF type:complete len:122 (-),score=0.85 GHVT01038928.1:908-1273(-)
MRCRNFGPMDTTKKLPKYDKAETHRVSRVQDVGDVEQYEQRSASGWAATGLEPTGKTIEYLESALRGLQLERSHRTREVHQAIAKVGRFAVTLGTKFPKYPQYRYPINKKDGLPNWYAVLI